MDKALTTKIVRHLTKLIEHGAQRVFTETELKAIVAIGTESWETPIPNPYSALRCELVRQGRLTKAQLSFKQIPRIVYVWGKVSPFEVLDRVDPRAYFSHHSAMYLHDLAQGNPAIHFLNLEQRLSSPKDRSLTQRGIDGAHRKASRISTNAIVYDGVEFCLLGGKNTRNLGVESLAFRDDGGHPFSVQVTSLERTLIDIATRAACAGGPAEVLHAFSQARDRVNVNRLVRLLSDIAHVYPHHQSIGFYMTQSGYPEEEIAPIRALPREFDFYLDKEMRETRFDPDWRIHVPAEL